MVRVAASRRSRDFSSGVCARRRASQEPGEVARDRGIRFIWQPELAQRARTAIAAWVLVVSRDRQEPILQEPKDVRPGHVSRLRAAHHRIGRCQES